VTVSGKRVWLTTINDVTARRQAEQALREAGERLRFMAESMPQKIFTARPDGAVDYFNQRWVEYTGAPLEALRDWGWTKFLHPEDAAEYLRAWRHSVDAGEPLLAEHRLLDAGGAYRWHLTRAVAFTDADGMVSMWIGSSTDIHEMKVADRRKDEFLALLAHELRGPLAPLSNMLEVARRSGGKEEVLQRAWRTMERQLAQMTRLIDDLLDVSRISHGRLELRREPVEIASALHQAIEACEAAMAQPRHEVTLRVPSEAVYVNGDRARLAQMFSNLLTNACKYSEPGTPISVTAERQGEQIVVAVKDAGIGIAPDMLPRVFDMFMQVDRSSYRSQGGLGIGLALVHQLAQMHGGSVTAFSAGVGLGAEFVVRLPAPPAKVDSRAHESADSVPAPLRRRILVVDDNKDSAESLAALLEMYGHETRIVTDGLAAAEAADVFRPQLIFCDIGLPGTSGYEVARAIRKAPWATDVVLIAITGWGRDEDRRESLDAGFDAHVVKPVDPAILTTLLKMRR
jgi:PAS domain S-box-containing protein